ncbi:MAG: hypothetical protein CPSOU_2109 [uncultured Paraburkholderia sp.]|nr:MAG: hypothetical protein CPSOU_2109 [uncultured Paraburkholderia sp.]
MRAAQPRSVFSCSPPRVEASGAVCVEAQRETGVLKLFFFRHDDGFWHVFPPVERPAMRVTMMAA